MPIVVRGIDPAAGQEEIVRFLFENLTKKSDQRRFEWLYRKNPWGEARVWIAREEGDPEILGVAAAFPRMVRARGKDYLGWNLGDFVVRRDFRSLGPALALQKACLKPVLEGEIPFCYDHPSKGMFAIYQRMGIASTFKVIRYAKPVTVDRYIQKYIRNGAVARGMSTIGNKVLLIKERKGRIGAGLDFQVHRGKFGEEFDSLNERSLDRHVVCGHRTSAYLNWRYVDNPLQDFETVMVRKSGKLAAYSILSVSADDAFLCDLFGDGDRSVSTAMLRFVSEFLRHRKVRSLSAPVIATSSLTESLIDAGFYPRESEDVVFCTKRGGVLDGIVDKGENWFLNHGDRDL